ncbi:MAG: ABC transporter permease [Ilumatobacteraceae bacterium]
MARFLLKRLGLAIITLWLLATIVFAIVNVLPGNVGRQVLGPFASQQSVDAYNHELGTDRPLINQYSKSLTNLATFDFGNSYSTKEDVAPKITKALFRSAKLAGLALILTVPIGIAAGAYAARRKDKLADRTIVMTGLATSSMPEFVTATILVALFCSSRDSYFRAFADPPDGTSFFGQFKYLFMPGLAMAIVYFGYIARITRAGVINALEADYSRTAIMKGLTSGRVMRRHVLRNALGPTISVVGVQIGYLFGGILGVEKVFNYHGLGTEILNAIGNQDLPILSAAVLTVGIVYMLATLAADVLIAWLNPRVLLETKR